MIRNRFTHLDEPASPNVRSSGGDDVYDSDVQQRHKSDGEEKVKLLSEESEVKRWKNWRIRTIWALIMISSFFGVIAAGHFYLLVFIAIIQTLVYKEVIAIAFIPSKELQLPWFRALNWYFLFSTTYFLYGETFLHYFKQHLFVDAFLQPLATYHRFISMTLYIIGFVLFVANLKKGHYKFQFSQFSWTHMALLLVTAQSQLVVNNLFEGIFWFFVPVSAVVVNDIFAYICGFFWGKTQLIKISPKKTVEGFVGAFICTLIWGVLITEILIHFPYVLCPAKDLSQSAWNYSPCELNPVFIKQEVQLTPWISGLLRHLGFSKIREIWIAPIHFHVLILASFASLIAPFGGFFASGVKRAFKIKDFGDSIPGHGGLTDRMDCQFLMSVFSYIYYQSFLKPASVTVGAILQLAVTGLTAEQQLELYESFKTYLKGQHVLPE